MTVSDSDHLQQRANGILMYRRRVPSELVGAMGKIEIKVSFATDNRRAAQLVASRVNQEVDKAFELLALHPNGSNEETEKALERLSIFCAVASDVFHEVDIEAHKNGQGSKQT